MPSPSAQGLQDINLFLLTATLGMNLEAQSEGITLVQDSGSQLDGAELVFAQCAGPPPSCPVLASG